MHWIGYFNMSEMMKSGFANSEFSCNIENYEIFYLDPDWGVHLVLNVWNRDRTAITAYHFDIKKDKALQMARDIIGHYGEANPIL